MPNHLFRSRNIESRVVTAFAIQDDTRDMLKQMLLPLIPQRRVKGALSLVSRETGLPFSKLRRVYYGITDHILAFEWQAIANAYTRHVERQEQLLTQELETLRTLKASRLQRGLFDAHKTTDPRTAAETVDVGSNQA